MRILLICNDATARGNGLSSAVRAEKKLLEKVGAEVRIMAAVSQYPDVPDPDYPLKHFVFPVFEFLLRANCFRFATFDRKIAQEALEWCDVAHFEQGFPNEGKIIRIARKMGKPCVGSYHLFAQNVMANVGFGWLKPANDILSLIWKIRVYDKCSDIHCPTQTTVDELKRLGFKSELHLFSNGIEIPEERVVAQAPQTDPITIICIGRLSNEKKQETLLNAMKYSRYADRIQLVFAGKGQCTRRYKKISDRLLKDGILRHEPVFEFLSHEEIAPICRKAYLFVHCAWVEIEGLSCLEAIREGTVPLIAKGPLTATSQFALDDRSTFPIYDSVTLAEKIDWWIEHPQERLEMGQKYADLARNYDVRMSTKSLMEMYQKAIARQNGD